MTTLRIAGGRVVDPANGVDDEVIDLWIADGQIVPPPDDPDARADRTIDARGYVVMLGYWDDPAATAAAIDAAGWMHTGDLAAMGDDGYVNIVGRSKDVIIRGGENIAPREVEEFLHTHPAVSEAQVIGVPSAKYGEEVMAWVKPRDGAALTAEALAAACRGRIAAHKIPRHWRIVDDFPMTVTGKVQKFAMRAAAGAELDG